MSREDRHRTTRLPPFHSFTPPTNLLPATSRPWVLCVAPLSGLRHQHDRNRRDRLQFGTRNYDCCGCLSSGCFSHIFGVSSFLFLLLFLLLLLALFLLVLGHHPKDLKKTPKKTLQRPYSSASNLPSQIAGQYGFKRTSSCRLVYGICSPFTQQELPEATFTTLCGSHIIDVGKVPSIWLTQAC